MESPGLSSSCKSLNLFVNRLGEQNYVSYNSYLGVIPDLSSEEVGAVKASTWDLCGCEWDDWKSWETCDSSCFGTKIRKRSVWLHVHGTCDEFTDCASSDEGTDYASCNQHCENGGTLSYSSCICVTGYTGKCCSNRISCGSPSSISNGHVSYSSSYYGASARYTCKADYRLTGGSSVRKFQSNTVWSGRLPSCVFSNYCRSSPCRNGATCTNLQQDYSCKCMTGWAGKTCDEDVQLPVMSNCPADISVNATETTIHVTWVEPSFHDPLGNQIDITNNYPEPKYNFPWGDFTVQYTATKLNNGLTAECLFTIKVRPTPCKDLQMPVNGARICNGWKTDYGRFCLVACNRKYMIDPKFNFEMFYICGASGNWLPAHQMPNCSVPILDTEDAVYYHPRFIDFSFETTCQDANTTRSLQELYIQRLGGEGREFKEFCTTYPTECQSENVAVNC